MEWVCHNIGLTSLHLNSELVCSVKKCQVFLLTPGVLLLVCYLNEWTIVEIFHWFYSPRCLTLLQKSLLVWCIVLWYFSKDLKKLFQTFVAQFTLAIDVFFINIHKSTENLSTFKTSNHQPLFCPSTHGQIYWMTDAGVSYVT